MFSKTLIASSDLSIKLNMQLPFYFSEQYAKYEPMILSLK